MSDFDEAKRLLEKIADADKTKLGARTLPTSRLPWKFC